MQVYVKHSRATAQFNYESCSIYKRVVIYIFENTVSEVCYSNSISIFVKHCFIISERGDHQNVVT